MTGKLRQDVAAEKRLHMGEEIKVQFPPCVQACVHVHTHTLCEPDMDPLYMKRAELLWKLGFLLVSK